MPHDVLCGNVGHRHPRTNCITGRNKIPDQKLLEKFHTIDIVSVYTGARPNLIITSRVKPGIWSMGNGCEDILNLSNQTWILARMYNQDEQEFHNEQLSMLHVVFLKQQ